MTRHRIAEFEGHLLITKFPEGSNQGEMHHSDVLSSPCLNGLMEALSDAAYQELSQIPLLFSGASRSGKWFRNVAITFIISRKVVANGQKQR
jgi:hypothetical protein